ncbi:MAG TPA: NUDIX domain-containing protein [Croceibacterium sp.]|nr:NUDIX domain-containing protein [Croceibacterium sp.]
MLRLIPPPLHRQLYRLAYFMRRRWLRLRGGTMHGCILIARDDRGGVLLVRHSYGSGSWQLPGGGVGRKEQPEHAIRREIAEELGCEVRDLASLGTVEQNYHGATNVVHVFTGGLNGWPQADGRELVKVRFFPADALPARMAASVRQQLELAGI